MQCVCAKLSSVALLYNIFPHFLKNDFRKFTEHKMCFDFIYNFIQANVFLLFRVSDLPLN